MPRLLKFSSRSLLFICGLGLLFSSSTLELQAKSSLFENPDFTKGDPIPGVAPKDWNLGATGARGWIFSERLETTDARQIRITRVAPGSPADGFLEVGDVIVGVDDQLFTSDARSTFGQALTRAESISARGRLHLLRWREGRTRSITIQLPVVGDYSPTSPYNCPKSARILRAGSQALAATILSADYQPPNPISRALNALALLATGEDAWMPAVRKEIEWARDYSASAFTSWYYAPVIMLLAEYSMITGDKSVRPGLRRLTMECVKGQSIIGSWGHRFAGPDGRLVGYGMMNSTGAPLTIALELARRSGIEGPEIDLAIERSAQLLRFYIGKGALPYGDHDPWVEMHEDNGKCGMAAVLFNLLGEPEGSRFFSRMSLASFGNERDTGHTGNFWNMLWAMPGVSQSGPHATGAWMNEFGGWYFDLARQHDGFFAHQGPPQPKPDSTPGWDATGAYLLAYAMPLKKLYLTGRQAPTTPQLNRDEVEEIMSAGRNWTNTDRYARYEPLSNDALLQHLGSWSPVVRERAATTLAKRGDLPVSRLIERLDAPKLELRLGACQALAQLGPKAAPALEKLAETLEAPNMWLRIKAAEAIAGIGAEARRLAPKLLAMLIREPGPEDPRAMEQRYLIFTLFNKKGLLGGSLEGVDRDLLKQAIHVGLRNQDGRARYMFQNVYDKLPSEELRALLTEVHFAVVNPAPSGIMFADGIRIKGLEVLADSKAAEGIDAALFYLENLNHWGSEKRVPEILEQLRKYGVHAKRTIPDLQILADQYSAGIPEHFPRQLNLQKAEDVRRTIRFLEQTEAGPELVSIQ